MNAVREASTNPAMVADVLAAVDGAPASYMAAARRLAELGASSGLVPMSIGVLASFTLDLIAPYLVVEGARRGYAITPTFGPFGQLEQQALDPESVVFAANPQVIVVALDSDENAVARIEGLLAAIRKRSTAHVIVCNVPPPQYLAAGLADPMLSPSQQLRLAHTNEALAELCRRTTGTSICDVARVASEVGTSAWYDTKLQFLARAPWSSLALRALAKRLGRHLCAVFRAPSKCLVLDLDNTLWGGVLGEDGVGGIKLGDEYPGSAYKAFQRAVRNLRDRGVLLAIASKNNESDVAELFSTHAEMVLKRDEFAVVQTHWNDKAGSLRAIADELNIGIDSLVFFDDNPMEREWVKSQLPEVHVVDVPKDPAKYVEALESIEVFDQLVITAEDRGRTRLYQDEAKRKQLEQTAGSLDDFLRALEVKAQIGRIDRESMARVVQLLGKTNQFNVTTRRYDESQLSVLLNQSGAIGLHMRVADRYGDNGLVGVAIAVEETTGVYRLDSFLMSCRVLGRRAEQALLHVMIERMRTAGAHTLLGEFIPTKKNAPAARFFHDAGFSSSEERTNWWTLDISNPRPAPELLEIIEQ